MRLTYLQKMHIKFNRLISFIAMAGLSLFVNGCWSSRELNQSALVAGVGFDRKGANFEVIANVLQPSKLAPKFRGQTKTATFTVTSTGRTVFEATRRFPHKTSRKMFWSHCEVFMIGKSMTSIPLTETLNYFYRSKEYNPLSYIAMVDGKVSDMIGLKTPFVPVSSFDVRDTLKSLDDTSMAPRVQLKDLMQMSANPVGAAYMPIFHMNQSKKQATIDGTGIFLQGKYVGKLSLVESRGLLLLVGKVVHGAITFPTLNFNASLTKTDPNKEFMSLRILHASTRRQVSVQKGMPMVIYHVRIIGDIAEDPSLKEHTLSEMQQIERRAALTLMKRMKKTLEIVRQYHADVIEAGEAIRIADPGLWHHLESKWQEEFLKIPVKIDVHVTVRNEGLIQGRE